MIVFDSIRVFVNSKKKIKHYEISNFSLLFTIILFIL
jgi:hypothetical protein